MSLAQRLWESFKKTYGPVVATGGVLVSWLAWWFAGAWTVPAPVFAAVLFLGAIAAFTGIDALLTLQREATPPHPKIVSCREAHAPFEQYLALLHVEDAPLLALNSMVTINVIESEDGFERRIGVGQVVAMQDDGAIQVGISSVYAGCDGYVDKLKNSDSKVLLGTRLRSHLSHDDSKLLEAKKGDRVPRIAAAAGGEVVGTRQELVPVAAGVADPQDDDEATDA